jgi:hypothetical protein
MESGFVVTVGEEWILHREAYSPVYIKIRTTNYFGLFIFVFDLFLVILSPFSLF